MSCSFCTKEITQTHQIQSFLIKIHHNARNILCKTSTKTVTQCILQCITIKRSSAIAEGPCDASCQLKSCQLPRNSAETTYTTSSDQIDGMKLEILSKAMLDRQCALNHDATESAPIVSGVTNKPTTVQLCISPVYDTIRYEMLF